MSKKMRSHLLLILTAMIWGSAFVAQKSGMELVRPFTFNTMRTVIGALVLMPVIAVMSCSRRKAEGLGRPRERRSLAETIRQNKTLLIGGVCCGTVLFVSSSLQQFGLEFTTAGKAGFITALYVVIVPILSIVLRKRVRPIIWLCALIGVAGLYLLCMTDDQFRLTLGDSLVLLCAFAFSGHIMVVDHFSPKVDGVKLSCVQFLTSATLGTIAMLIFEHPDIGAILDCWLPIAYAGVLSSGVAYTLQVVAQKHAEPTVASLLMSLESVFAVIAGTLFLHESMTPRELIGCVVIFAAVIIAQLPSREERLAKKAEKI